MKWMQCFFALMAFAQSDSELMEERLKAFDLSRYTEGRATALVFLDLANEHTVRFNEARCNQQFTPCSTFKIFNSLAGLETGVLVDANTTFQWDGTEQNRDVWERDHNLSSAFKNSVVWYYQRVARAVGAERMQAFLDKAQYGNRDISGGIDTFWLQSSFRVSPNEQVDFLKRLFRNQLPFSFRSMELTRALMVHFEGEDYVLQGKTGSAWENNRFTEGWYVGRIKRGAIDYVFACQSADQSGLEVRDMMIQIFRDLELLPAQPEDAHKQGPN